MSMGVASAHSVSFGRALPAVGETLSVQLETFRLAAVSRLEFWILI